MTKRKIAYARIAPIQPRLFKFREMALKVISTKFEPDEEGAPVPTNAERDFLAVALWRIGRGVDANEAFGVKANRGERRKVKAEANVDDRLQSPLRSRLLMIRRMAFNLVLSRPRARRTGGLVLSEDERDFLALALDSIGHGAEAKAAFGVKAKRGERRSPKEAAKADRIRFAMSFIAAATTTEVTEFFTRQPISLKEAMESAAARFRFDVDSLRTYWGSHPELRSPSFERPITSLP